MGHVQKYILFFLCLACFMGMGQEVASTDIPSSSFEKAYTEAYEGKHVLAQSVLLKVVEQRPDYIEAQALLGNTYSWEGQYEKARETFNEITSKVRTNRAVWISTIKNELYAKNAATALGLSNKALGYLKSDIEIMRLRDIAIQQAKEEAYTSSGWFDTSAEIRLSKRQPEAPDTTAIVPNTPVDRDVFNNRLAVRNAYTVFDQRYDPVLASSISYKRQTLAGSIIPRVNYNNRRQINGLQYELDFYPKFSKRFYAYLNYGFSKASIFPNQKIGGDLYVNLPGAIEFSTGGRHLQFDSKNVSVVTNSLGHYRGNYYFSLRSYITPMPDNLTRISGNLLIRKYGRDAENYMGITVGMGYSPELRQLTSGDELLAETLLYVESQRLGLEYQFTGKENPNIYRANMGLTRQELAFDSGNYFWSVSAGFTYQVKF